MFYLEILNKTERKNVYKNSISSISQNSKDNLSLHKKIVYNEFSSEIRKQLEEIDDYRYKKSQLLLENITKLENENKMLAEENNITNDKVNILKAHLKNVQVDANSWKENYENLQLENKKLLAKLHNTKNLIVSINVDSYEEIPINSRQIIKENNNNESTFSNSLSKKDGL